MKKVRLFAVAAAMGMFASTVTAAETTTTGYAANWTGVEEIIKVDVGNKVVAPVSSIKVVKEVRTTDKEEALDSDYLGLDIDVPCYVGNTNVIGEDDYDLGYTDVQVTYINGEVGFYNSVEEAVDVLANRGLFLAAGAAEREEGTYATKWSGKSFADYEEVLAYAVEEGFVEYVYDEDGELTDVLLNEVEISDKKGNVKATTALKVTLKDSKYAEEETLKAVVNALVKGSVEGFKGNAYWTVTPVAKKNYTEKTPLVYTLDAEEVASDFVGVDGYKVAKGQAVIVEEDRYGDLIPVKVVSSGTGLLYANGKTVELDAEKITVLVAEEADREFKELHEGVDTYYNVLMSTKPVEGAKWSAVSTMVWDIEAGAFLKEETGYEAFDGVIKGFWWEYPVKLDEDKVEQEYTFGASDIQFKANILGLFEVEKAPENDSDKIVLFDNFDEKITGINTKTNKMTLQYTPGKELTVSAVKLDNKWYPAVDTKAELVKVAAKLYNIGKFGVAETVDGLSDANIKNIEDEKALVAEADNAYYTWYVDTEAKAENIWSGFSYEGSLPVTELRGEGSVACTYKVADGEEVTATVEATEVDTTEAGVKTMTLKAIVDGETVSTKDVKVVVAPRYERTYVNGKVAVLKAYYAKAEKVLYSEYHYDWANGTYTATFYANDGVTVASTASGSLN